MCPTYYVHAWVAILQLSLKVNYDDDISEMWKRLDEKYGDPAKVAELIIDGIRRTRIIREGEEGDLLSS